MTTSLDDVIKQITELAASKGIQGMKIAKESVQLYRAGSWMDRPAGLEMTGKYDGTRTAEKQEFEKTVNELLQKNSIECEVQLKPNLKNMKFPTITKARAVTSDSEQDVEVAPKPGEVTLFDFWATWCGPCQGPMAHNQEMLVKHPEWAGKARIVGVSIDDEISAPKQRVTEKGWTKVDQYWVNGGWGADICKTFAIHGIPFCALVDKKGEVQLSGHPASMALEENIPRLINDETLPGGGDDDEEEEDKLVVKDLAYSQELNKADLTTFIESHSKELALVSEPLIASVYQHVAKEGKMTLGGSFVLLRFMWTTKNKAAYEKLKADFETTFEPKIARRFQDREIKLFTLAFGSQCSKCTKVLGHCDQYLCISCTPPTYFCTDCIDSHKDPKTVADLGHPHGLYYIQKGSETSLESVRYGNLRTAEGALTERSYGGYRCDGCDCSPIVGSHWKCVICADVDICDACMAAYKDPNHTQHTAVIEKAKGAGHDMHTHIYAREDFYGMINFRAAI